MSVLWVGNLWAVYFRESKESRLLEKKQRSD
uniref:Uncharacterized protein n=1 Tax=Arundo donax TaxID=35708 RepID=A0A0A8Y2T9_ARUDO